jgi:DNA-binding NarL/FixJ family response regulator
MRRNRILIADAHLTMMAGVRLLLKDTFEVSVMVADHDSLRDTVKSSEFDLVIADLSIPMPPGENVARLLKRLNPVLTVIILSVHDESAVVQECLAAGAKGFVLKRAAVNDLIPAVDAVLRGDTYVSPSIQISRTLQNRENVDPQAESCLVRHASYSTGGCAEKTQV